MLYRVSPSALSATFEHFRRCGRGSNECQVLWIGPWTATDQITEVVHPVHMAHSGGFELDSAWLTRFFFALTKRGQGVRVQVHTHPGEAFHSSTDDLYPIVNAPGFLSLVIPNFATGPTGFADAYLAEIQVNGQWREVPIAERIVVGNEP